MNNVYFSADINAMWSIPLIFAVLGLWFFPLTAAFSYQGRWRVFWLPRVWCGFASPCELSPPRRRSGPHMRRLPLQFWTGLGRRLLPRLRPCRFGFYLIAGSARFYCIAGVTVGHIILSIAGAALQQARRRMRKRRILWLLKRR